MRTDEAVRAAAFGWPGLARWAGVAVVALLFGAGAGFRDVEAAAIGVAGIVALALLRVRRGGLGRLALALLFADVAFWMIPAAAGNLAHSEQWISTALPSALALASLVGIVALAAAVLRPDGGRAPLAVAVVAAVLLAGVNVAAALREDNDRTGADAAVAARGVRFSPDHLAVDAGRIVIEVGNLDLFWHTFTIRELGVDVRVPVQADRLVTFDAPAGTYEFVCAIPGHTQAGMKGVLVVR